MHFEDGTRNLERCCKKCRFWAIHTGVEDRARGGWLTLGHCEEDVQPRGMTAGDYCCAHFAALGHQGPEVAEALEPIRATSSVSENGGENG